MCRASTRWSWTGDTITCSIISKRGEEELLSGTSLDEVVGLIRESGYDFIDPDLLKEMIPRWCRENRQQEPDNGT